METNGKFEPRSAIEALRAGVPNSFSVHALGCDQPRVERAFADQLDSAAGGDGVDGLLIKATSGPANRTRSVIWANWRSSGASW